MPQQAVNPLCHPTGPESKGFNAEQLKIGWVGGTPSNTQALLSSNPNKCVALHQLEKFEKRNHNEKTDLKFPGATVRKINQYKD